MHVLVVFSIRSSENPDVKIYLGRPYIYLPSDDGSPELLTRAQAAKIASACLSSTDQGSTSAVAA